MTVPSADAQFLAGWMSRQRWYANKGSLPQLEEIGNWPLPTGHPGVLVVTHFLMDRAPTMPVLYQVPLVYRDAPLSSEASLVAELDGTWVYDGPHDSAYTTALLEFIASDAEQQGDRAWARGHRSAAVVSSGLVSRVLTGEQSNTSIIFESDDADALPLICKVFRALHDGDNPDVELQGALADAGSHDVPLSVGFVVSEWNDVGATTGTARGHLAFVQEFVPGALDTWRVALRAADLGEDFSREAAELGVATARVHATLATRFPTAPVHEQDIADVTGQMRRRLAQAVAEVPSLREFEKAVLEIITAAESAEWPAQQRIHGDLHLGQVLSVQGRGWVFVDFEGEPMRPMHERSRLDSPLRDVAGMLRSFDYVAGTLDITGSGAGTQWAAAATAGFRSGYSGASGIDLDANRALLDAFEIDKALYEAVYEVRNRPTWLPIPVSAVARLAARVASA